jgi:hypothetical protein
MTQRIRGPSFIVSIMQKNRVTPEAFTFQFDNRLLTRSIQPDWQAVKMTLLIVR